MGLTKRKWTRKKTNNFVCILLASSHHKKFINQGPSDILKQKKKKDYKNYPKKITEG